MMFAAPNGQAKAQGKRALLNGRVVDPSSDRDETGGLLIEDGLVVAAGPAVTRDNLDDATAITDVGGAMIMPGVVDMRCHIGEPGGENRETIGSASHAAAAGGVTSLVMMPDTSPAMDDVALIEFAMRTARDTAIVRILPSAATTKGFAGREMSEYGLLKEAGAVMLSQAATTISSAGVVRRSMTYARDFDLLYGHVSHDAELAGSGVMNEGLFASWLGLPAIPREAELLPLERDLRLVRLTGARYHAELLSAAMSADAIRMSKADGLSVSAGVSINHLALNENDIGEYRTFFKMTPPLRHEDDRQAMVAAIADGTIDVICSAHDPRDVDQKRLPFAEASDGAVGLETMLAASLRLYHAGDVPLMRLVRALSTRPAELLGTGTGTLKPGAMADVAIVDLDHAWIVKPDAMQSKSRNSCFEDARMTGRVIETIVAGRTVFRL